MHIRCESNYGRFKKFYNTKPHEKPGESHSRDPNGRAAVYDRLNRGRVSRGYLRMDSQIEGSYPIKARAVSFMR
jgi:hypothetical protein